MASDLSTGGGAKLMAAVALSAAASSLLTYAVFRRRSSGGPDELRVGAAGAAHVPSLAADGVIKRDAFDTSPRTGYLSWDDYFMAVAFLSAQRSKDPSKQVGACIVDCNQVICGIGYNGFPRGCPDSRLPWAKSSRSGDPLATKYPYVCHAEMNAILNKNGASVAGAKVYVTMFPCNECAKLMIQAGIKEIVFHENKEQRPAAAAAAAAAGPALPPSGSPYRPESPSQDGFRRDQQYAASRKLLAMAGVRVRQHLFTRPVTVHLDNSHGSRTVFSNGLHTPSAGPRPEAGIAAGGEVIPALAALGSPYTPRAP